MKTLVVAVALSLAYVAVFVLGGKWENLSLDPARIAAGEVWRVLTFSFAHLNAGHLAENVAGVLVAGVLATELKAKTADFLFAYSAAAIAVVPVALLTGMTFVGASSGIYGAFAVVALEAKDFGLPAWKAAPAVVGIIFLSSFLALTACGLCNGFFAALREGVGHFTGFSAGIAAVAVAGRARGRMRKGIFETGAEAEAGTGVGSG